MAAEWGGMKRSTICNGAALWWCRQKYLVLSVVEALCGALGALEERGQAVPLCVSLMPCAAHLGRRSHDAGKKGSVSGHAMASAEAHRPESSAPHHAPCENAMDGCMDGWIHPRGLATDCQTNDELITKVVWILSQCIMLSF
jgi:hypothetical protein